ncbi:hypothetical protein [Bradyrhizobium iriomotense]|uniref:Uncharacterized protein n=1 Tax=Bradyrhizobium iriomotense TaxID=441950 RepID=A0ABQ6BFK0_9BRAD|nr:hypothetical protein [Bradyrhizobium iriomotense]GLR92311.1 hypothetical protein GCM10007857_90370 [Bradyrhizobium iriomotense]
MLPGFRFLFAAILLSASILVFGLGAAALLRATHEQFVSNPSWRNGPQEQVFAQASEPTQPALAAFRAEPVAATPQPAPSERDLVPTVALPQSGPEQAAAPVTQEAAVTPTDPPAVEAQSTEPIATPPSEPAKAELAATIAASPETAAAASAPLAEIASVLTAAELALPAPVSPPASREPQQAEMTPAPTPPVDADVATTKLVALSDPAAATDKDPPGTAKAASDTPDKQATKQRAHRAKKRHRIVRRPPPPPVQVQQAFNPFATQPLQQYQQYQRPAYAATTRAAADRTR